jgi:hypothetical protein
MKTIVSLKLTVKKKALKKYIHFINLQLIHLYCEASQVIKILPDGEELEANYNPVNWDKSITAFPYQNYDPFIEFAWQAVTVVHGTCFATFKPNVNMHHKYTNSMKRLFGRKIKFRWYANKLFFFI